MFFWETRSLQQQHGTKTQKCKTGILLLEAIKNNVAYDNTAVNVVIFIKYKRKTT